MDLSKGTPAEEESATRQSVGRRVWTGNGKRRLAVSHLGSAPNQVCRLRAKERGAEVPGRQLRLQRVAPWWLSISSNAREFQHGRADCPVCGYTGSRGRNRLVYGTNGFESPSREPYLRLSSWRHWLGLLGLYERASPSATWKPSISHS